MTPGSFNPTNLLLSLATAMATASDCTLGVDLFIHQLPPEVPATGASVLRVYGGPEPGELRPVPVVSVQCMTHCLDAGAGMALAMRLYASLYDQVSGRPRQTWAVPAKRFNGTTWAVEDDVDFPGAGGWDVRLVVLRQPPGLVGRDDAGRWQIPFNFDVRFSAPEVVE